MERVAFFEESCPGQTLKLVITSAINKHTLDALEDFISHQRKRLEKMPQSSDELRALMGKWFGDEISEYGPMSFLEAHGFKLRQDWHWELPTPAHTVSCYEMTCLQFLFEEWDFGGVGSTDKELHPLICLCHQPVCVLDTGV